MSKTKPAQRPIIWKQPPILNRARGQNGTSTRPISPRQSIGDIAKQDNPLPLVDNKQMHPMTSLRNQVYNSLRHWLKCYSHIMDFYDPRMPPNPGKGELCQV